MEILGLLIVAGIVVYVYNAAYDSGKRVGSRKGYGVGYSRGLRGQSSGCLVMIIAATLLAASATAALAWLR